VSIARRLLMSFLLVGAVSSVAGVATFASFSAQTTNSGSTFATGTMVLSDKVNAASACLSTAGLDTDSNANAACTAAFALTAKKPGDSDTSAHLTLKNDGSIDATAFKLYAAGACAAANDAETYHGTGNPCTVVDLYVQETASDFSTNVACFYPTGLGTNCAFNDTKTLSDFSATYLTGTPLSVGALTNGATRYFVLGVKMPSGTGNSMQGRQASIGFTWEIDQ
jgi:predicted ribosomally synthesized peptide with SipW-like signal peptide